MAHRWFADGWPMRALTFSAPGAMALTRHPDPVPGPSQLLVAVGAAGVNRADLLQRAGKYPAPAGWPADIPGLEYAGEVAAVGAAVTRWRAGDRVMGLAGGGAQAELLLVDEREAMPIPANIDFVAAAAIPEAFLTGWDAMMLRGRAVRGDRVLVHAIGGGVGTAAAQLGRMAGCVVIGTSRTAAKLQRAAALGASHGVLTSDPDWPAQIGDPVQVVLDTLGAAVFADNIALLAPQGRLVLLSTMTGATPSLDIGVMLRRRLEIIGTAMRVRSLDERAALATRCTAELLPRFAVGELVPVVDSVVPMTAAGAAYDRVQSNDVFGKVVLAWPGY